MLAQHLSKQDIETGRINRLKSSRALLSYIIYADFEVAFNVARAWKDLKLLLETSTKILPYLQDAIVGVIRLGRTELASILLFFVAFDHSYFNHMVLFRQLAAGNSFRDVRKLDPFTNEDESVFLKAILNGNKELANLILDKAITFDPLQPFRCSRYNYDRQEALLTAVKSVTDLEIAQRIRRILENQRAYEGFVGIFLTISGLISGLTLFCAKIFGS